MDFQDYLDGKVRLYPGDCIDIIPALAELVDSIVCDPPYGLEFMNKEWDKFAEAPRRIKGTGGAEAPFAHHTVKLDRKRNLAFQEFTEAWGREAFKLLKPGGYLLAFGGSRTFHRLACGLENVGFEVRDTVMWVYGSGFPKSHDVSKAIDKEAGKQRERIRGVRSGVVKGTYAQDKWSLEYKDSVLSTKPITPEAAMWEGWGTALKPAFEPVCVARKPIDCIVNERHLSASEQQILHNPLRRYSCGIRNKSTIAQNVLKYGTGGINIDDCRIATDEDLNGGRYSDNKIGSDGSTYGSGINRRSTSDFTKPSGRWPANFVHDGSEEVLAGFPSQSSTTGVRSERSRGHAVEGTTWLPDNHKSKEYTDKGSPARFFYTAKADAYDRAGSKHPTVKPVDLMQWLVRLVTPHGGLVLDPFAGTGTTAEAAFLEGMRCILIERDPEYLDDIARRMDLVLNPEKRKALTKKSKKNQPQAPLF